MDESCQECCRGAFFECKDPTGLCGPWVECRLIQKSPCRVKRPAKENGGLGPKILVLSKLKVILKQYILSIVVLVKRQTVSGGNSVPATANIFKQLIVTRLKMVKPLSFCFEKLNVTFLDLKVVYLNQLDGDDLQTEYVKGLKENMKSQDVVVVKASKAVTDEIKNIANLARQLTVVEAYQVQKKRRFKARALPVSNKIIF